MPYVTPEDEYTDLPEPEHVSTMMDGIIDTIAGNEGLSYAQHYMHSVLQTSGGISNRTGTEGFFSAIGDGLKSAWDYIVKMFKSIWNFFFGSSDDTDEKKTKEVEEQVEKDAEKINAVLKDPKSPEKTAAAIKGLKGKVKKIIDDPKTPASEKKEATVVEEKLNQYAEEKDWCPEIKAIAEKVMNFSKLDRSALDVAIKNFMTHGQALFISAQTAGTAIVKSSEAQALHERMLTEFKTAGGHLNEVVKKIKAGVHSLFEASELQKILTDCLKAKGVMSGIVKKHKTDIQREVNKLGEEVKKAGNEDNGKLHDDLAGCKDLLTMITHIAKTQALVNNSIKAISKANAALIA
jgi:predicted transcriptional regulator